MTNNQENSESDLIFLFDLIIIIFWCRYCWLHQYRSTNHRKSFCFPFELLVWHWNKVQWG